MHEITTHLIISTATLHFQILVKLNVLPHTYLDTYIRICCSYFSCFSISWYSHCLSNAQKCDFRVLASLLIIIMTHALLKRRWMHDINENSIIFEQLKAMRKRKSLSLFSTHTHYYHYSSPQCALFDSHRRNKMRISSSSSSKRLVTHFYYYSKNKDMINVCPSHISNILWYTHTYAHSLRHTHTHQLKYSFRCFALLYYRVTG